jgi:hypothetical protein
MPEMETRIRDRQTRQLIWLKRLFWIYFWLLLFEGALRKWIAPQFAVPLLVVRDPIVLLIYWQAYRCKKIRLNSILPFILLGFVMLCLACIQILQATNTVLIAAYGLRSYALHLPLVLVMGATLNGEDVKKFGRWFLVLALPMAMLMVVQFYSTPASWVNNGAGEDSSQIAFAEDHIRPAGTFSFVVGIQCFIPIVTAFLFYALNNPKVYPRWIVWTAAAAVIASIPVSGSRTLLFVMCAVVIFAVISGLTSGRRLMRSVQVFGFVFLIALGVLQFSFFSDASSAFESRWLSASQSEGGVAETLDTRVLGVFRDGFDVAGSTEWLGKGIGLGSNVAAVLLDGTPGFLLSEYEWARIVQEFGPFFGLAFIVFRIGLCVYLTFFAFKAMRRRANLSWLLLAAALPLLIMGTMEQPTELGFIVLTGTLCLAAAHDTVSSIRPGCLIEI